MIDIAASREHMGAFYANVFDPALIVSQIVALQCLVYIGLAAWLLLLSALSGRPITAFGLEQMFSAHAMDVGHSGGWTPIFATLLNALAGGWYLRIIVERAKKCLDFAATFHIVHLACCALYDGFLPYGWEWWVTNLLCVAVTALVGERLCMKREMREIPLLGYASR